MNRMPFEKYRPFPPVQMAAVTGLCRDILARHPIAPDRVVGHSDIAPERKADPGELFEWDKLAEAGIGLWPRPASSGARRAPDAAAVRADLASIGYCPGQNEAAVMAAFQRRFRPRLCDGVLDAETAERASQVADAYAERRSLRAVGR